MSQTQRTKVVVVDDHPLLREGLVQLINKQPDLACCGEASDAPSALAVVASSHPDLLVLDLRLKGADGLDLIKTLRSLHPELRILILSQHDESVYALRVLRAGAQGYVMKEEASQRIIGAVHEVLEGRLAVSPTVQETVLRQAIETKHALALSIDLLSDREIQVLNALGEGLGTREIARKFHLSPKTIDTYRENIKAKLHLPDAKALLEYAENWVEGSLGDRNQSP